VTDVPGLVDCMDVRTYRFACLTDIKANIE